MLLLLATLALSMQGCLGIGGNNNFTKSSNSNGAIGINNTDQAIFKGKIYFTLDSRLYMIDGTRTLHQLTQNTGIQDPAVSPDGKWIAFTVRYKDHSDLVYMPANGGPWHTVISGSGHYVQNSDTGANDSYWFFQPAWSSDSTHLLFLSDLQKQYYWSRLGGVFANAYFLDLQVFSLPINAPTLLASQAVYTVKPIAYAAYGDGGDRDPAYRPNHPNQVIYTHYMYDPNTQTKQLIQIFLEDATLMAKPHYPPYTPLFDPAVPLTPGVPDLANLEPAFSPDGNFIAYVRRQDATHDGIYIMPVADGVTDNPNNPDVQKKALAPYDKSSLILTQQYLTKPTWSPDGKQLAYITYTNNNFDIWLANLSVDPKTGAYTLKGDPVQLTDAGGHLNGDSRLFWTQ
jgi:Tol biopolymer transport system component